MQGQRRRLQLLSQQTRSSVQRSPRLLKAPFRASGAVEAPEISAPPQQPPGGLHRAAGPRLGSQPPRTSAWLGSRQTRLIRRAKKKPALIKGLRRVAPRCCGPAPRPSRSLVPCAPCPSGCSPSSPSPSCRSAAPSRPSFAPSRDPGARGLHRARRRNRRASAARRTSSRHGLGCEQARPRVHGPPRHAHRPRLRRVRRLARQLAHRRPLVPHRPRPLVAHPAAALRRLQLEEPAAGLDGARGLAPDRPPC